MQKIVFLSPGRVKTSWIQEGCDLYIKRLKHDIQLEVVEIPPSKQIDPVKHADDESERLLEKARKFEGDIWLLDERGQGFTSLEFSQKLTNAKDIGRTIVFLLGGAYGVNDTLKKEVNSIIRLSDMTFPHELCQLIFFEQLYRAIEIQKGSGYHH
ncbi:MAG: rRNA (pseudouridine1915-N3)-methyltransferase [Candidatus Peribacteria bacterium]|nr:rRNA (pseudouridine1915-N3)-methyltransferase [Candidatus Peribacteria bacterium]